MKVFKKPYEISLWEDRLTFVDTSMKEYESFVPEGVKVATSYYRERKICIIGSHTLASPARAINPQLKRNVNGSNTLTFSIYSKYYDESEGKLVDNPFVQYLVNERKVKLKYIEKGQEKWLDFIIKNISENSETYLYSYTAQDLFVNELSKTGYSLTFDAKLNNNSGTVEQLGERILNGTDWRIKGAEPLKETQEEALYAITLTEDWAAIGITSENVTIPAGQTIYTFYSCIANETLDFFQFLYRQDGNYEVDDDKIIINADEYYSQNVSSSLINSAVYTNVYRGRRHVRQQKQAFDNALQKYVYVYTNENGNEVYGYTETEYITSQTIKSYISNPSGFSSTSSWVQMDGSAPKTRLFPSYEKNPSYNVNRLSTLEYKQTADNFLFNSGITDDYSRIDDFVQNDIYIFRIDCRRIVDEDREVIGMPSCDFNILVKSYHFDSKGKIAFDEGEPLFEGHTTTKDSQGFFYGEVRCKSSLTKDQLKKKRLGIFISASVEGNYYIVDSQFFKKVLDKDGNTVFPLGQKCDQNKEISEGLIATIESKYYFYYPGQEDPDRIEYVYIGNLSTEVNKFSPVYNSNYEKVRSITASGSNRFSLLQTLSETFECWCRFEVEHKPNGEVARVKDMIKEITYNAGDADDIDFPIIDAGSNDSNEAQIIDTMQRIEDLYRPLKYIKFQESVGQINNVDFIYGVNLKSINRTLESNELVTKLIVKTNSNQFARQGGCDISRAQENPTGGNILYNFNQYITQGILNAENFNNDLYSSSNGWMGFYTQLKKINTSIQQLNDDKNAILNNKAEIASQYTFYSSAYEQDAIDLHNEEEEFYIYTKYEFDALPADSVHLKDSKVIALGENILRLRASIKENEKASLLAKQEQENLEEKIKEIDSKILYLSNRKENLISTFENKYSRFIQEGPWSSEDYVDDTLYYLDAESTLHNSAQPKMQYTIVVIEVSMLEGYENFSYALGDITHIQDTEYFGWVFKDGRKTPYREKVVVTETVTNFESPEKDSIKVQNHRTQFEDLFQRMAAVTQKVEFHSGEYERAASAIKPDGTITPEALSEAFSKNGHTIQNATNQSVKWDDKGITTTNTKNPSEIVRIVSGGVFISNDGGATWTTGITGNGINAKTITAGSLNTGLITIYNGNQPAFRWDDKGLSAYRQDWQGNYDTGTYVRYDQFGLYGVKNASKAPTTLEEIWQNAAFSLTWRGFKLKTGDAGGSVSIDTEEDFVVTDSNGDKVIQIGRIEKQLGQSVYGIIIKGKNNQVGFRAIPNSLNVGGWEITDKSFEAPNDSFIIYSDPQLKASHFSEALMNCRIYGENFILTESGTLYTKGLHSLGQSFTLRSSKMPLENDTTRETEITDSGVIIRIYDQNGQSIEEKSITWDQVIDKIKE